jgi:hypothetical protein
MSNWFNPKINKGEILPDIVNMLQPFDYMGLTDQKDTINQIASDIMRDDFNKVMFGSPYLNIYHFAINGKQFYCCDRAIKTSVEIRRHMSLLTICASIPTGFEITTNTNEEFINNDCEPAEIIGACQVRVENIDDYVKYKSYLTLFLPHLERFSTSSSPVSFFSFPEDSLLGYHVSGRLLIPEELNSAVAVLKSFS